MNEVVTTLLDGRVKITQPEKGFRAGTDTVLLAAFAPLKPGLRVLDAGCGVGSVALCLLARERGLQSVTGLELQSLYHDLALKNIALNDMAGKLSIIQDDIRFYRVEMADRYDLIVCNPPYFPENTHQRAHLPEKATAMGQGEDEASLKDWFDGCFHLLQSGGCLTIVQRADMLDKLITLLSKRFGAIEVFPVYARKGQAAKRVLIRAYKGRKSPLTLHYGIVMHADEGGDYTQEAEAVLRQMQALPLREV